MKDIKVEPMDRFNEELVENVHPKDWINPPATGKYNLVVIGGGTAGLVTAAGAAGLGAKVALIEKHLLGGDCLNVGCVPSKALIRSSRVIAEVQDALRFGIKGTTDVKVDFSAVMKRMRAIRAGISHHDSVKRFTELGVDIFLGEGSFSGSNNIVVDGQTLHFKKAVIASGARAVAPRIEGIENVAYLTNETVFSLTKQPKRLAVIGGGPIGCELAQAFQRLGSKVILIHKYEHLLNREDADAAAIVQEQFKRDGVELVLNCNPVRTELRGQEKVIHYMCDGKECTIVVDEILAGAGRVPNIEGLNLEVAGVKYDKRSGVVVNDCLRTTNSHIYAAGDVCMNWKFTHAADAAARIVIQNALFLGRKKLSSLTMPWCTYTEPEIAHVGMYEKDAREKGIETDTYMQEFKDVDRALTDGEEQGFVKVIVRKGTDKIIGATMVANHAGDMISELTLAIVNGIGLGKIGGVIHPYPTQAEAIKKLGDAYNRTRLTPFIKKLFARYLSWQRHK